MIDGCDCCVWFTYHRNYLFLLYLSAAALVLGAILGVYIAAVVLLFLFFSFSWWLFRRSSSASWASRKKKIWGEEQRKWRHLVTRRAPKTTRTLLGEILHQESHHLFAPSPFSYLPGIDLKARTKKASPTIRLAVPNLPLRRVHESRRHYIQLQHKFFFSLYTHTHIWGSAFYFFPPLCCGALSNKS